MQAGMQDVYFVTSNLGKLSSLKNIIKDFSLPFKLKMLRVEYPEDKTGESTQGVVLTGAKYCADKYQKNVIVTDTGIFIKALNGFPGVNTKFAYDRIGNKGILKLMEGEKKREVEWILSLGYCEPGRKPVEFTSSLKGITAEEIRGDKGFGFDPIFIPNGYNRTFAQDPSLRDEVGPFRETVKHFVDWYRKSI